MRWISGWRGLHGSQTVACHSSGSIASSPVMLNLLTLTIPFERDKFNHLLCNRGGTYAPPCCWNLPSLRLVVEDAWEVPCCSVKARLPPVRALLSHVLVKKTLGWSHCRITMKSKKPLLSLTSSPSCSFTEVFLKDTSVCLRLLGC